MNEVNQNEESTEQNVDNATEESIEVQSRPEWLPEKFWTENGEADYQGMAKSYSELEAFVGKKSEDMEAQVIEKPVISILTEHDVYGIPKNALDSCLISKIEDFQKNFVQLVQDSNFSQKIIQNGNKQLENDFYNIGNSAEIILKEVMKND